MLATKGVEGLHELKKYKQLVSRLVITKIVHHKKIAIAHTTNWNSCLIYLLQQV